MQKLLFFLDLLRDSADCGHLGGVAVFLVFLKLAFASKQILLPELLLDLVFGVKYVLICQEENCAFQVRVAARLEHSVG